MNILFVSGFDISGERKNANAICVSTIVDALRKHDGVCVDVIADHIFEDTQFIDWKKNVKYMIKRIIKWPCINPDAEARCFDILKENLRKKEYDAILVAHKPYETVRAAVRYKRKHNKTKIYLYLLDPIANEIDANIGIGRFLFFLTKRAEKITFSVADHAFHMQCNREKYASKAYETYSEKFSYLDFPIINNKKITSSASEKYSGEKMKMVYSGTLDAEYRSPQYLIQVMQGIREELNFQIDFFTKGNCDGLLLEIAETDKRFSHNGFIPQNRLQEVMEEADYLINIGNKYSTMLPSKLLTYIESGKPIIHFSNQANDACLPYLEKYPNSLILYERDSISDNVVKLEEFLMGNYGRRIDSDRICSIFHRNTPEWSALEILRTIREETK